MRFEKFTLVVNAVATDPDPSSINVEELIDKWVQVAGAFTATAELQGSIDGTNFVSLGALAAGLTEIPETIARLRVHTSADGTVPTVTLAGRDARSD